MSSKLLRSTATVGGLTFVSRILGFIRDIVIAHFFGASSATDAFLVAFKIPNFMRRLFAEGAFSQAFVPVLSEYKTQRNRAEVKDLLDHTAGTLGGVLFLVTALGMVAAPGFVLLFAPGFWDSPEKFALTSDLLRVTFPYLLLVSLTALAGAILNVHGHFAIPALTPVLLNISLISAAIWGAPYFEQPITALAWGVFVAGLAQWLFQLPFLARLGLLPRFRIRRNHPGVRRILRLMLPALFGVSITQINILVDTLMASFLVSGSVSWLYYSDRLIEFPLGVFGLALATVMLPTLSRAVSSGAFESYTRHLDWSLRWVFFIGLPSTLGLMALAGPIMTTLFYRGEFSAHDVLMSSRALVAYTLGLVGFILVKVLASGFYARQNTRTPVLIGAVAMLSNIVLNLLFIWPLAHVGLALATACAALINAGLLFRALRRSQLYRPLDGWTAFMARLMGAGLVMVSSLFFLAGDLESWLAYSTLERAAWLSLNVIGGGLIYFVSLAALGLRPRHLQLG